MAVAQLGRALAQQGRPREGLAQFDRALELAARMPREYFLSYDVQIYIIKIYLHQGEALDDLGRGEEAREAYKEAIEIGETMAEDDRSRAFASNDLAAAYFRLSASLLAPPTSADRCREANRLWARGSEVRSSLVERKAPPGWPDAARLSQLDAALEGCQGRWKAT